MRLLLLSNSTMPGAPYLGWCAPLIRQFLGEQRRILFLSYAGVRMSPATYCQMVRDGLGAGYQIDGIEDAPDPVAAVESAEAVAIGGGNTFRLLERIYAQGLIAPLQAHARAGKPLLGWSAGSNVCGPTIKTTNDMPIIQPASFDALRLTEFQINAHFTRERLPKHGGESRMERLNEFLVLSPQAKIALMPEGSGLELCEGRWLVRGLPIERLDASGDSRCFAVGEEFSLTAGA